MDRITKYIAILSIIIIASACSHSPALCPNEKGDVDGDGIIAAWDAALALNIINRDARGSECELYAADFNEDGVIDNKDVDAIYVAAGGILN